MTGGNAVAPPGSNRDMQAIPPRLFSFRLVRAIALGLLLANAGCAGSRAADPRAGSGGDGDFGIPDGTCNRRAIGAVLGGAIGGVIGAQVGEGAGRRIAILVGAAAGTLIGSQIGRRMDETDRACMGEALEKAGDYTPVEWPSADGKTTYRLTPLPGLGQDERNCRAFELQTTASGRSNDGKGRACRGEDGLWRVVE